ncbi:MAG TPA: hypothetical protein EYP04_05110, partial [Anaerolineae bacterium]|nr:hypothetical protein [Anaerolineae bacterium]
QSLPGRRVAVKENFDPSRSAQEQFKREAVILARLKHPNLPQVTDHFIEPSGRQYLVMDYIEGEDLDQILAQRGPLPEAEVLGWMDQVLDALEYMHTWVDPTTGKPTPVIHRDIKPDNIKRTPDGRIMLVDFGIVKYQTDVGTRTGARAVSPISPVEQYTGGTDVRSDVYTLGATLYWLLTGKAPPESPDIAAGRIPLKPPRTLNPAISRNTERVILRAMQTRAANRYQTVGDLKQALAGTTTVQVCAVCGAANKATARFCFVCGSALRAIPPFAVGQVATWSAGGAFIGAGLAYLPWLVVPGSAGTVLETALYAGVLFFGAVGAVIGALIARKVSIDAPDFLPRFIATLVTALGLESVLGFILGAYLMGGGLGPVSLVLAFLGSVGGGVVGTRLTESKVFRQIKWE